MLMDSITSSPVAQEPAKKSSNTKVIIVALVALLVGVGATAAFFLITGNKSSGEATNPNASPSPIASDSDADVPASGVITNARLVEELATKTNRILGNAESSSRNARLDAAGSINVYKKLSDSDKAMVIVNKNFQLERKEKVANIPDGNKIKDDYVKANIDEVSVLDIDDYIISDYKYLFGNDKEPTWAAETGIDRVAYCTHFYIPEKNYYVSSWGCGGATDVSTYGYQYKYAYEGNKAYVYIALGSVKEEFGDSGSQYTIRSGLYDGGSTMSLSKDKAYTIATSLEYSMVDYYKDFAHYRVVFEKDSTGNYAYKTVEEVED